MKSKIFLYLIFLTGFQTMNAQNSTSTFEPDQELNIQYLTGELFTPVKTIDQSTWFNIDWLSGDIYLSNGEIVRNKPIRYNGALDELFWLESKSGNVVKLDKEAILEFHFLDFNGDTSVYFKRIKLKSDILADSGEVFVQELYNGKLSLYVFHTFFVERKEIMAKNNVYFEKEIYVEKPVYFLNFDNKKTVSIKSLNSKSLYKLFPDKIEEIKQFFKSAKKVKTDTKQHVILLMKFLNNFTEK